jgi:RHS repeat-associated protein
MKTLCFIAALCFANATFAQDAKKDTTTANDYGMRMYDARLGRYISTDTIKYNPYSFADTTLQPADKPKNITATK